MQTPFYGFRKVTALSTALAVVLALMVVTSTAALAGPLPSDADWTLVRRVGPGLTWHPSTDSLAGTDVYGSLGSETSSSTFSINFESAVAGWDQVLLITGDRQRWMIMDRAEITKVVNNQPLEILSSFLNPSAHSVLMVNRASGYPEDPWLSAEDHFTAIVNGTILYGEASFPGPHAANVLPEHNGANVFIRRVVPEPASVMLLGLGTAALIWRVRRRHR